MQPKRSSESEKGQARTGREGNRASRVDTVGETQFLIGSRDCAVGKLASRLTHDQEFAGSSPARATKGANVDQAITRLLFNEYRLSRFKIIELEGDLAMAQAQVDSAKSHMQHHQSKMASIVAHAKEQGVDLVEMYNDEYAASKPQPVVV